MAYLERRPGRKRPYRVRYRTPGGELRSQSFARRAAAEKYMAVVESDKARGAWLDPRLARVEYEAWSKRWMKTNVELKPKTQEGYRSLLRTHIIPTFGGHQLREIEPLDVKQWVGDLREGELSASRVRQAYRVLSASLKAAVESGYIGRSPCIGVKLPRMVQREMLFLSAKQVEVLVSEIPDRYKTLVYVLAYGGLRWGEAAALRRKRCDMLRSRLVVTEAVAEVGSNRYYGQTKTNETRHVILPAFLKDLLAQHFAEFVDAQADALIFTNPKGLPIRHRDFWEYVWKPAVERAKMPTGLRIHDLRHTCAALLISRGAHPKMIQSHLGHSTIAVTFDRYGHLFPDDMERLAEKLDALWRQRGKLSTTRR